MDLTVFLALSHPLVGVGVGRIRPTKTVVLVGLGAEPQLLAEVVLLAQEPLIKVTLVD
jgi:hypothetical protein